MAASAVTLSGGSSELIIAADDYRDHITLQLHDANPVYLAFGEAAVTATGIVLLYPGCSVRVTGAKARDAAYGFAAGTPTIGIETSEDIEYRPGAAPSA
jgi:hypothetical protein